MAEEPQIAVRQRTFLKGALYYDSRRASIECVIRDLSDSGARLVFEHASTVPDNVELYIPSKQQTLRARVRRRGLNEVGISFEIERSTEPRRASDQEIQQRLEAMEAEIATLKRIVAKLKAKVLPLDQDVA